jgi:ribosomal-protein-alanine N-acetyltransferase
MSAEQNGRLRFVALSEGYLDAILAIEVEAYPEPWTIGMFRSELRNSQSHFFVILFEGDLVGYGGFWLVVDEAHITSVTVKDVVRGRGYGRQLMDFLLDEAKRVDAQSATLEVRVSNLHARNLYLSLGFRPVGLRKGYYPKTKEDAMIMLKEFE